MAPSRYFWRPTAPQPKIEYFLGNWWILRLWTMARARVMVLNSRQNLFLDDIFEEIKK
jgi:hypothetical protein